MLVGLFGGSFDPIHHAHLILAQLAREQLGLAEVRFVPAHEQPFKRGQHGAPAAHRVRMTELAIAGTEGFAVDRVEVERQGASYTVDTLRTLTAARPDAEFVLLLGHDAAVDLPKWREPEAVRRLARVAVFARPGTDDRLPVDVRRIDAPQLELSSTDIRERVRRGRSIRYYVPDAVADHIAAHGLYRDRT